MTFSLELAAAQPAAQFFLRAGYHFHRDPRSGEESYARRLGAAGHYPRFHAYLEAAGGGAVLVNLHVDQKQPSYGGGTHAHAGEYDGPLLERERDRLLALVSPKDVSV